MGAVHGSERDLLPSQEIKKQPERLTQAQLQSCIGFQIVAGSWVSSLALPP